MSLNKRKIAKKKAPKNADRVQIYERGISAQYFAVFPSSSFSYTIDDISEHSSARKKKPTL